MKHLIQPISVVIYVFLAFHAGAPSLSTAADGSVTKRMMVDSSAAGGLSTENLLLTDGWHGFGEGFESEGDSFVCDNGGDTTGVRGAAQTIVLNQTRPAPIIASAESRCEGVEGVASSDYSLYVDLVFTDGTTQWSQTAIFDSGTHDWQRRQLVILPTKPVRKLSVYLLLRNRSGKAWFRNPRLGIVEMNEQAVLFDGLPVIQSSDTAQTTGFQVRDVAANSDFVQIESAALGLTLDQKNTSSTDANFIDVTLMDTTGVDRAVTLIYTIPLPSDAVTWFADPRSQERAEPGREYIDAGQFHLGANGRISRYPFAAVACKRPGEDIGVGLGIDMAHPAVYRVGYNSGAGELFLAYDLALTPEQPTAKLRLVRFKFDPAWGFRSALDIYYKAFPDAFQCRVAEQGLWMPFAKISEVEGWEDFGFRFKEGNHETKWDDDHNILTFRYTEPMTWWMAMPPSMPRTMGAALGEANRLADEENSQQALAFRTSGFFDTAGNPIARLLDTPWYNGAVWSVNGMPEIDGTVNDFSTKWNQTIRDNLYGWDANGRLDGEYIDSSEGYVTAELDFRRDHFAAARTPLTFSTNEYFPAIFRGLIAYEYINAISKDIHRLDRFMMANSTPSQLCFLAPLLDVMGTETNWNPGGKWQPMSDAGMLYRRSICKGKPFCFLMNSEFETFSHDLVDRYMQRCLAYGMFPGFFSHNASEGHYFSRPELYNRDRDLFKKYVPLCKSVAEAGWEPITLASSSEQAVYVERFGTRYLTLFNDSPKQQDVGIELHASFPHRKVKQTIEMVSKTDVEWTNGRATFTLAPEQVAVIDFGD